MTRKRSICVAGMLILLTVLILGGVLIVKVLDIQNKTLARENACIIKNAVLEANIVIRSAAMAPTIQQRKLDLNRRFLTRERAENAYKVLETILTDKATKDVIKTIYTHRNKEYRLAQNKVVELIETSNDNTNIWDAMQLYNKEYLLYTSRIEELTRLLSKQLIDSYYTIKLIIICSVCSSTLLFGVMLFRAYIDNSEASLCQISTKP